MLWRELSYPKRKGHRWPFSKRKKALRVVSFLFYAFFNALYIMYFVFGMIDGLCIGYRDLCRERRDRARVFSPADLEWINSGKLYPFETINIP